MRKISDEMKAYAQTDDFKEQVASNKLNTKDNGRITQRRKYKLITPLFGGGVKPKEADPIKVIRETSIRGQLRFWWRAMRGVGTLAKMKEREDALFGSGGEKASQSKVLIYVKDIDNGRAKPIYRINNYRVEFLDRNSSINYAGFSLPQTDKELRKLRDEQKPAVPIDLQEDIAFSLEISFPESETVEIEAALWAWETFGGIGGRTRRGFGAIQRADGELLPSSDVEQKIRENLQKYLLPSKNCDERVPHLLLTSVFKIKKAVNSQKAWENLIDKLRQFRQARREGSDPERPMKKGRSYWSEPDEIRRMTGRDAYGRHKPKHNVHKFPRAEFGLPIIFHFIGDGEPGDTELKPVGFTRLASPLILRPIACSDGAVGIALILETPPLPSIELKGYGAVSTQLVKDATTDDIANIEPMLLASATETDVLKSFLETI
jgi:CRISPR-associated protein Cmr1